MQIGIRDPERAAGRRKLFHGGVHEQLELFHRVVIRSELVIDSHRDTQRRDRERRGEIHLVVVPERVHLRVRSTSDERERNQDEQHEP
jgi:hypothetical protein